MIGHNRPSKSAIASRHKSFAFSTLSLAKVDTFVVDKPNVIAEVMTAAPVEKKSIALVLAVGRGAKANRVGSKVMIAVATAEPALSTSEALSRI